MSELSNESHMLRGWQTQHSRAKRSIPTGSAPCISGLYGRSTLLGDYILRFHCYISLASIPTNTLADLEFKVTTLLLITIA